MSEANAGAKPPLSPEDAKKAAAVTEAIAATFGRMMALLTTSPRHRALPLEAASALVMPPMMLGQFAVVGARNQKDGPMAIAAAAWWAFVSPDVDQRLSSSRDAVLRLEAADWKSGSIPWIVDVAGDQKIVNELLKQVSTRNFQGARVKLRAFTDKGQIVVGKIEPPKDQPGEPGVKT